MILSSKVELLNQISNLPHDFHKAGVASRNFLRGIMKYCGEDIEYSAETGCGLTTLLFSHLSKNHKVFAVEDGGNRSISAVRSCELFNPDAVEFIIAPTQVTLPKWKFPNKLDVVLLDGPHGFPFPQLEYYYFYPHIREGGVLVLDDIHIPTIYHLYKFLKEDDMFKLMGVLDAAAFFQRTSAPLFDPFADGWWLQGFNKRHFPITTAFTFRKRISDFFLTRTPESLLKIIPAKLKEFLKSFLQG